VTQIAMSEDKVYALSDGSLYSVNKVTEEIEVYNNQSGLHSSGITCIHYDSIGEQLIIGYGTGKIDIMTDNGVRYIGELYNKDMTQRKTINNVTIRGRVAYLSTAYGVQTMDLRENKLVDSYWLRPNGQETDVKDVLIARDSIFAFTDDSLFCASLSDELVDYSFWQREGAGRVERDAEKGVHYIDGADHWYASGAEGIVRFTNIYRLTYKPQGPLTNTPYRMRAKGTKLGIVQGGYDVPSYNRAGIVMTLENGEWHNYDATQMNAALGMSSFDYCDIAFDPEDKSHFFVASHGYGLLEFRADTFYMHHNNTNSQITPIISTPIYPYLWVDGLQYDSLGNLWMLNNSTQTVKVLRANGEWVSFYSDAFGDLDRSKDLIFSNTNPNICFISTIRKGIGVLDYNGTIDDSADDRSVLCSSFQDSLGNEVSLPRVSSMLQTNEGVLLIGTQSGLFRIAQPEQLIDGYKLCMPVIMDYNDEGRTDIFSTENIRSMCLNDKGQVWIGTQNSGLYLLSADLTEVLMHLSIENSPLPSNDMISLCYMAEIDHLFIGTAEGLVEYAPNGSSEGLSADEDEDEELSEGEMLRWRLHLSYSNAQEIAASPTQIYALANGALFSVDKADESIVYWSKANGMNGTSVSHIAYDDKTKRLVVTYANGQIDLIDEEGDVTSMPDISMKAGSIDVSINSICVGEKNVYLAMPFGVIAIDTKKAEVSDTYYIGTEGASIAIQAIAEIGDTLYAFSYDRIYKASKADNLVDYTYWHNESIPFEKVQQVAVHEEQLYALYHDTLYRCEGSQWNMVKDSIAWIHTSGSRMLCYQRGKGLMAYQESSWQGISNSYVATDAIYTNGEYWLAEEGKGLVRLSTEGDDVFLPEGPLSNFGYHLDIAHDQLYVSPGGRWAEQYGRQSSLSIYDGEQWRGIPWPDTWYYTDHDIRDAVQYAVDPNDAGHFFVATYGTGLFEFKDYKAVKHYDSSNSPLQSATPTADNYYFTRTDGTMIDGEGNLWVMNATTSGKPIHILAKSGQWYSLPLRSGGADLTIETPAGIWTDQRNSNLKWMLSQRANPYLICLNDNGTPTYSGDDRCMVRNSFVDQNGNVITPTQFRCFAQDKQNRIWIGTNSGIVVIPEKVDFFSSNTCQRIIIPRNDGTNLADYLLGDEQINCLAVDGGNRMWIGTANSGLYLIEDDTITVAHFTETNSLLPSNSVQSIAIMGKTGEVFVGTDNGIASYRSDASEAQEDMNRAYAFPNPVRPNYVGSISICGLMENTVVNIIDSGGGLVCKTKSHGGTAVWDGKLSDGRRATPGIYTALCNSASGHTVVKIMVIR